MPKSRNILPPKRFWTPTEEAYLRAQYPTTPTPLLAALFGRPAERVLAKANAMGLKKNREFIAQVARERTARPGHGSVAHRFKPGLVPSNKGVKHPKGWAPGDMAKTQFKPGNRPHTWVPVGSFRMTADGIIERKYSDDLGPSTARWRNYAALVWEAANGPVPKGRIVAFHPGKKTTDPELVTLDRLECISRAENIRRNSVHHLPEELKQIVRLRGSLTRAINTKVKETEAP